jgi:hypothetical protein
MQTSHRTTYLPAAQPTYQLVPHVVPRLEYVTFYPRPVYCWCLENGRLWPVTSRGVSREAWPLEQPDGSVCCADGQTFASRSDLQSNGWKAYEAVAGRGPVNRIAF